MVGSAVITGKAGPVARSARTDHEPISTRIIVDLAARRPLVAERHRRLGEQLESAIADDFISGRSDIHGLLAMLKYLQGDFGRLRHADIVRSLIDEPRYREMTVRTAVVEQAAVLRENLDGDDETVTAHIVGVYRQIRDKVASCQGEAPSLGDLRGLPMTMLTRVIRPRPLEFGALTIADRLVYTPSVAERSLRTFQRIRHAAGADALWLDANGDRTLRRCVEEPLTRLPDGVRRAARQLLVAQRIRSEFYREVFLHSLAPERIDVQKEHHATVLQWLEDIAATSQLFPFMQGQTAGQKAWRLAQLTVKIVRLHEMYARLEMASRHPAYVDRFPGRTIRERLAMLSTDRYPPLALTRELTLAALLCPFTVFALWVQERVKSSEFVLPPDPAG